jgi:hypothetical protein
MDGAHDRHRRGASLQVFFCVRYKTAPRHFESAAALKRMSALTGEVFMRRTIITCHEPHEGRDSQAVILMRDIFVTMLAHGHRTPTPVQVMRTAAGNLICVFEMVDERSVDNAHADEVLQAKVAGLALIADMVPIRMLVEASDSFGDFEAVEL